jgi:hypothetical protein
MSFYSWPFYFLTCKTSYWGILCFDSVGNPYETHIYAGAILANFFNAIQILEHFLFFRFSWLLQPVEFWSSRKNASLKRLIVMFSVKGVDLCASVLCRITQGRRTTRVQWSLPSNCQFLRLQCKQAHYSCATSFPKWCSKRTILGKDAG